MKVYLKFKNLHFALMATEFLYNLHPFILKQALDMKRSHGSILGTINLEQLTYVQSEQLSNLKFREEDY